MKSAAACCRGERCGFFGSFASRSAPPRHNFAAVAVSRLKLPLKRHGRSFVHAAAAFEGNSAACRQSIWVWRMYACAFASEGPSIRTLPDAALCSRFLRPLAQVRDQAAFAPRFARQTSVAPVQDKPMVGMALVLRRHHLFELHFDFMRIFSRRQAGTVADAEDMRVDRDGRLAERNIE